jgi:hypothetical protein
MLADIIFTLFYHIEKRKMTERDKVLNFDHRIKIKITSASLLNLKSEAPKEQPSTFTS